MSQAWKQTKLDLSTWKKRPRPVDEQDPAQGTLSNAASSPSETSLPPSSSTSSLSREPQTSGTPSSNVASTVAPLTNNSELQDLTKDSVATVTRNPVPTYSLPEVRIPPSKAASVSFTSSQFPSSSGSQRVVQNGEMVVTNSDEETDSSSLEDLDDLIKFKESEVSDSLSERKGGIGKEGLIASKRVSNSRTANKNLSDALKTPNYKFSLTVLAEQQRRLEKSGEDIARVNAVLEARRQAHSDARNAAQIRRKPDDSVIDAIASYTEDGEEIGRLKDALRRTEALHHEHTWSFFHTEYVDNSIDPSGFPELEHHDLQHILRNASSRQQAFLNGYVEEYVAKKDLPDELFTWILKRTCSERREDLRLSYIHVLVEHGLRNNFLMPNDINELFRSIGARDEALKVEEPILPYVSGGVKAEDSSKGPLLSALKLIQNLASSLRSDSSAHTICIMCRLFLDSQVVLDVNLMTAIDETLNRLIESIPESSFASIVSNALAKVYRSVTDSRLRLQLVRCLPVYDLRTAIFRRRLALAYFFEDTKYLQETVDNPWVDLGSIAKYLETPRFKINKKTDYSMLTTSMAMLDIGLDAGDPSLAFATNKDEQAFDNAVDQLSMRLKDLSSQIVGTSALDMRRTEAKEILHAMQRRLTYTLRSRAPLKKSILSNGVDENQSERKAMSEFLESKQVEISDHPADHVVGTSTNQDSMYRS